VIVHEDSGLDVIPARLAPACDQDCGCSTAHSLADWAEAARILKIGVGKTRL
jgi:hypothetical protein